ncbi:hypothetical protein M2103_001798 [Ereboglobus sp. PH5-5]|nr:MULTISPECIES: hypothetical protein [unclassified Ereboglobus]MDF9827815.1 hypothetical protein [Ereboglobus sp. PH5-10]MDF9833571.1 hypothetical protein [Ereboglobus sp. PH5-5]
MKTRVHQIAILVVSPPVSQPAIPRVVAPFNSDSQHLATLACDSRTHA